jgi:hypothetical protein
LRCFVRLKFADVPLERDEGEYAYAGQLILHGVPPYTLAYNMKFPGTYYAYAALMAVFRPIGGRHSPRPVGDQRRVHRHGGRARPPVRGTLVGGVACSVIRGSCDRPLGDGPVRARDALHLVASLAVGCCSIEDCRPVRPGISSRPAR